jgi:glyoxylase-like metal-dependent hydrolase (beta-lactamase superfamily II)
VTWAERRWFAIRRLDSGIYLVAEPMHVNSFLIVDGDESVLLDTGLGLSDIKDATRALTRQEPRIVNTHHHYDHVGGNHLFSRRAIHEDGARLLESGATLDRTLSYGEYAIEMYNAFQTYAKLDAEYFSLIDDVSYMRPLPERFTLAEWRIQAAPPTELLREGDVVQCGRHRLTVFHTPGHSPDSICLLDDFSGSLFCGDTINTGPMLAGLSNSNLNDYRRSARRLTTDLGTEAKVLYMCHGPRYWAPSSYLEDVADAFDAVIDERVEAEPFGDFFGPDLLQASFGDFSIVFRASETAS